MRKYKFGFDVWGMLLFLIIMLPNFIWFAIPAPHDVLRVESVTPVVDTIGSVIQVLMIASLCIVINKGRKKLSFSHLIKTVIVLCSLYMLCWILYYIGIVNSFVILGQTIFPCLAFMLFSIDRKNTVALTFAIAFTICHLIYAMANFIL